MYATASPKAVRAALSTRGGDDPPGHPVASSAAAGRDSSPGRGVVRNGIPHGRPRGLVRGGRRRLQPSRDPVASFVAVAPAFPPPDVLVREAVATRPSAQTRLRRRRPLRPSRGPFRDGGNSTPPPSRPRRRRPLAAVPWTCLRRRTPAPLPPCGLVRGDMPAPRAPRPQRQPATVPLKCPPSPA